MDRLERLVNLVAALLDSEHPMTREELRTRVGGYAADDEAFRRNFERDKDALRRMGMPVVAEPLERDPGEEQVGYRVPRDRYELEDPGFTDEELAALRIAASAVRLDGPGADTVWRDALRKLAAAGGGGAGLLGAPVPEGLGGGLAELAGGEVVTAAFGAIAERRRVAFPYRGEERLVDPWRLSYRGGHWYLAGLDHHRGEERLFRLDRVEGRVRAVGDPGAFARPAGPAAAPIPPWQLGDDRVAEVRVVVDADQAPWAVASAGADAVVARHPDGAVELALAVTNRAGLRSWLLGFLDHAELLDPPEERVALEAWLAAVAAGPVEPVESSPPVEP